MSPFAQLSKPEGITEYPSCQPDLLQRISKFCLPRWTVTVPGEITVQLACEFFSTHVAPIVGGVVIAIVCDWPLTIDAQPDKPIALAIKMDVNFTLRAPAVAQMLVRHR